MADRTRAAVDVVAEDGADGTATAPGGADDGRTAPGSRHQESTRSDEGEAVKSGEAEAAGAGQDAPAAENRHSRGTASAETPPAERPSDGAPSTGSATEVLDPVPTLRPAPVRHSGDKVADRYRLEECITQAGVFTSWRAVDEKLRRAVGVHLLASGHERSRAVLAAARSAALLGDPRFVQVLDAVTEGDLVYILREWLPDATDLGSLLAAGPMEPYDVYQMVRQVTDAVAAAHRRGQCHLRLTPKCVLRTDSGQYRIVGIAVDAALHGLSDDEAELDDTRAIGALLYAALAHRWPYPEDKYDLQGMPRQLGCVPPDQVRAGVHRGLSEIAVRALCDEPPRHLEPITTPEELAKAIALLPKVRQPEPEPVTAVYPPRAYPQPTGHVRSAFQTPVPTPVPAPVGAAARPQSRPGRKARNSRGDRVVRWSASVILLAALGLGSWGLADHMRHRNGGSSSPASGTSSSSKNHPLPSAGNPAKEIAVRGAEEYDPWGSGQSPDKVGLTYDGNSSTAWRTVGYNDGPGFKTKPGVGIVYDLGSVQNLKSATINLQYPGYYTKVQLRAADASVASMPPNSQSTLAAMPSFGESTTSSSRLSITVDPGKSVRTRYVLIWLEAIPRTDGSRYRQGMTEVSFKG